MGDYHVHLHDHGEPEPGSPDPGTFPREHIERYVEAAAARGVEGGLLHRAVVPDAGVGPGSW